MEFTIRGGIPVGDIFPSACSDDEDAFCYQTSPRRVSCQFTPFLPFFTDIPSCSMFAIAKSAVFQSQDPTAHGGVNEIDDRTTAANMESQPASSGIYSQ